MQTKDGPVRPSVDALQSYTQYFGAGLVATDGIVYSPIVTIGTTDADVLDELIHSGSVLQLRQIELGVTQQFEGLNGSFVASLSYYWQARSELGATTYSYMNLTGTYTKGVGTLVTSEDTFSGLVPVGSVPKAPFRLKLTARGLRAAVATGKVRNSSFVRLVGVVIPGA